ncbi:MAG: hypothetical protein F4Z29_05570 [Gemmatimonadetes bacterium]|nr:hypothetical protein [Gemmatimonadota bacterium]
MTTKDAIRWLGQLQTPNGEGAGKALQVFPWERRVIRQLLEGEESTVLVSLPRENGKSTMCAMAVSLMLGTDAFGANIRGAVVAPRKTTAGITLDQVSAMLQIPGRGRSPDYSRARFNEKYTIRGRALDNEVLSVSDDHAAGMGFIPALVILDEIGFYSRPRETLETWQRSLGKLGGKLLCVGTRPADVSSPFHQLLEDPPGDTKVFLWSHADRETALTMKAAASCNPSWRYFPKVRSTIKAELARARKDEAEIPGFLAYRLNMPVDVSAAAVVVTPAAWKRSEVEAEDDLPAPFGELVIGVDLSGGDSFSAVVAYWPATGRLEGFLACTASRSIEDRDKRDRAAGWYIRAHEAGDLIQFDGHATDVDKLLEEAMDRYGYPDQVIGDRYKSADLIDACVDAGIPEPEIVRMMPLEKAELLQGFRDRVGDGKVAVVKSEIWRRSLANARIENGTGAAAKLEMLTRNKARRSRDDLVAAAILAVGRRQDVEEGLVVEPGGFLEPMDGVMSTL